MRVRGGNADGQFGGGNANSPRSGQSSVADLPGTELKKVTGVGVNEITAPVTGDFGLAN
ncbi:hypothetical protein ACIHEI_28660 [Kitasatospora sp. NPDC051984]|uniref:hypothetical protein n=1 Tax=Kitasatospora sp. NPDC051984 TaxID=3364059 RepID=UPI0037CA9842